MTVAIAPERISGALAPFRAKEWWDHKLAPMLGTGYMTALHLRSSLLGLWPTLLATLVGIAAAAAYVSLINDLSDLDSDAAAGKFNRLAERGWAYRSIAVAGVLAVGIAVAIIAWRGDPLVLALYAGPWVAFSLYSLPPVRLKARGAAGALADASGAHLFPQLLVTAAVFHAVGRRLEAGWLVAVGIWALACGIRGALWHQIGDVEADRRSGVNTFGRVAARARLAGRAAFGVESIAFLLLLWRAASPLAFALLVPYALLELARARLFGNPIVVVCPAPWGRIVMHDYYVWFYPLAFAAACAARHPGDLAVLSAQAVLFPRLTLVIARETHGAFRQLTAGLRAAVAPGGQSRP